MQTNMCIEMNKMKTSISNLEIKIEQLQTNMSDMQTSFDNRFKKIEESIEYPVDLSILQAPIVLFLLALETLLNIMVHIIFQRVCMLYMMKLQVNSIG